MSLPTFNSTALFTHAASEGVGSPRPRLYLERMPGVDGRFVQLHGIGGRTIRAMGILKASAASAALAHKAVKDLLRAKQALVDGRTLATYVGTDTTSYSNCVLRSFEPADWVQTAPDGTNFTATLRAAAVIMQLEA